jgi:Fe-S-cluster containining protein
MRFEITFEGLKYSCINCTYCCSCKNWRVYLTYFDKLRLQGYENHIEKSNSEYKHVLALKNGKCSLINDNLCRIQIEKNYESKPAMCKLFPFSFMVKWNGEMLLILKHYCNGVQIGKTGKKMINHAVDCCEELYHDQLIELSINGAEKSEKTNLDENTRIYIGKSGKNLEITF